MSTASVVQPVLTGAPPVAVEAAPAAPARRGRPPKAASPSAVPAGPVAAAAPGKPLAEVLACSRLAPMFVEVAAKATNNGALAALNRFRLSDADPALAKELGFEGPLTAKVGADLDALAAAYGFVLTSQEAAWIGLAMSLGTCWAIYGQIIAAHDGKIPAYVGLPSAPEKKAPPPPEGVPH